MYLNDFFQASMIYMRKFPSQRIPFFWAIVTNYMVACDLDASQKEKGFHGQMACTLLAKAVADIPVEGKQVKSIFLRICRSELKLQRKKKEVGSGRVLRNIDDLYLLLLIYESQKK